MDRFAFLAPGLAIAALTVGGCGGGSHAAGAQRTARSAHPRPVSSVHSGRGTSWRALHRRLHLPTLAAGRPCPVSRAAPRIVNEKYGVGDALGPGPVYPVLGAGTLKVDYRPEVWGPGPWGGQKVLWFVRPDYRGRVLIRGRRLDGPQMMRFDGGARPAAEIRIARGETVTWSGQAPGSRGRPSYVRVRASGCYAVQIDGTSFSKVVVFRVSGLR